MSYGGFYVKSSTSCLKAALLKNYCDGVFTAGRGKDGHEEGEYRYELRPIDECTFSQFCAHEQIVHTYRHGLHEKLAIAGGHHIWGMALI
jgi:hypothetical protein